MIDLWTWPLDRPQGETRRCQRLLAPQEAARASRFANPLHADRFVVARGRLREVLAAYVEVPAERIEFSYGRFGKPQLSPHHRLHCHFNLSHTDGTAILAISRETPVGIDIERVRPLQEGIPAGVLTPREQNALRQLSRHERLRGFFLCWTRKEACLKLLGAGLNLSPQTFEVSLGVKPSTVCLEASDSLPARAFLYHLEPGRDLVAALATMRPQPVEEIRSLTP